MNKKNPVIRFVGKLTVFYLIMLLLFSAIGGEKAYAKFYAGFGNTFFQTNKADKKVIFKLANNEEGFDTKTGVSDKEIAKKGWYYKSFNAWYTGFVPFIFLLSLLLATPFPNWTRRLGAFAAGILLIHFYFILTNWIRIEFMFVEAHRMLELIPANSELTFTERLYNALVDNRSLYFVIPIFIWIIVAFQKNEWKSWLAFKKVKVKG